MIMVLIVESSPVPSADTCITFLLHFSVVRLHWRVVNRVLVLHGCFPWIFIAWLKSWACQGINNATCTYTRTWCSFQAEVMLHPESRRRFHRCPSVNSTALMRLRQWPTLCTKFSHDMSKYRPHQPFVHLSYCLILVALAYWFWDPSRFLSYSHELWLTHSSNLYFLVPWYKFSARLVGAPRKQSSRWGKQRQRCRRWGRWLTHESGWCRPMTRFFCMTHYFEDLYIFWIRLYDLFILDCTYWT